MMSQSSREVPQFQRFAPRKVTEKKTPTTAIASPSRAPGSPRPITPNTLGGTTLFVDGMGSTVRRPSGPSHMFKSKTSIGDAHIKDVSRRIVAGPLPAAPSSLATQGSRSFGSYSGGDRDSYLQSLLKGTYGSPRNSLGTSPSRNLSLPTASFRSASPIACAHIDALTKPLDAVYEFQGPHRVDKSPSASFRSVTSIADAHIRAAQKMHDTSLTPTSTTPRHTESTGTSAFKSTTSTADAHIKAMPKLVDVVVAYRE